MITSEAPIRIRREFNTVSLKRHTGYRWKVVVEWEAESAFEVHGAGPDADLALGYAMELIYDAYPDAPMVPPDKVTIELLGGEAL